MNIGDAITACGLKLNEPEGDFVIVRLNGGKPVHRGATEVAHLELLTDTYVSGGVFRNPRGRNPDDLIAVREIQFDADLADYLGGWPKAELHALPDDELWPMIELQRVDLEEVFAKIGIPITRLDYTGYGLCAHTYLNHADGGEIERIKVAHKAIVRRVNDLAGRRILDPQVSDSGSRITRLPGCPNTKGAIPRLSKIIWLTGEISDLATLEAIAADERKPARITPIAPSKSLSDEVATQIVEHITPYWTLGHKHNMSLALAGMMAKAGVTESQAADIIGRISKAAGDSDQDDRQQSVRDSYRRLEQGLKTQGFFGLRDLLPQDLTAWIDRELGAIRAATAPNVIVEWGATPKPTHPMVEFESPPESAFTGWVGEYCNLVTPTTEASAALHLGVSLTTLGAMLGRQVAVHYNSDPLYANLLTVLVGKSNKTRKDTAIKRATITLTSPINGGGDFVNHGVHILRDVGSSTALISDLKDRQNVLLYFTELSRLIGNSRRKGTETIIPTLMEAFDTPPVMHNRSMLNPIEAHAPYVTMLAATQPDILTGLMTGDDMMSGFANRLLFICGNPTKPMALAPPLDWGEVKRLFHEFWKVRQTYPAGKSLPLSKSAVDVWVPWYEADWYREESSAELDALKQRHHVMIQKIALIYSVCDGLQEIPGDHLHRAIELVEWTWRNIRQLAGMWGRSVDGQIEARIVAALEKHGAMKRRDLQQKCGSSKWSGVEFARVFDAMVRNGTIVCDPAGMVWIGQ